MTNPTPNPIRLDIPRKPELPNGLGANIVNVVESIWRQVQKFAADGGDVIPDVVVVTGSGISGPYITFGHVALERWAARAKEGKLLELFIAGETLAMGAEKVVEVVLHEAAHVLATVRGVKDTTRQNRYHNMNFVHMARTFGLDYLHAKPHADRGYSACQLTDLGRQAWQPEIDRVAAIIPATIPCPVLVAVTTDPSDPRVKVAPEGAKERKPQRRRITYTCACDRTIAMFPDEHDEGAPVCQRCGQEFD